MVCEADDKGAKERLHELNAPAASLLYYEAQHGVGCVRLYKSIAELMYPRGLMLNFSIYQSGIDFKCPSSNRPLKRLTPLIGLTQSLFRGT